MMLQTASSGIKNNNFEIMNVGDSIGGNETTFEKAEPSGIVTDNIILIEQSNLTKSQQIQGKTINQDLSEI